MDAGRWPGGRGLSEQFELFAGVAFRCVALQDLLGALNRVSFLAQQVFDVEDQFDVTVGVDSVSGPVLRRFQLLELRFPVPQDILFEACNLADLADRVVEFPDTCLFHDATIGGVGHTIVAQ